MKTFKNVPWVGCCTKCDAEQATVQTEKGNEDWFYDGDKVTCENCGHTGVIEADGECAWCVWDEVDDSQGCNEEEWIWKSISTTSAKRQRDLFVFTGMMKQLNCWKLARLS
nr:hypothetical protein [Providencia alcalifaciens]